MWLRPWFYTSLALLPLLAGCDTTMGGYAGNLNDRWFRKALPGLEGSVETTPPPVVAEAPAPVAPVVVAPSPPERPAKAPPPKAKTRATPKGGTGATASTRSAARMRGGVSGGLQVIPSPPGFEVPTPPANGKGNAGVLLLSMGDPTYGEKAWTGLKATYPELTPFSYKVSKLDLGDVGTTYRLFAGPMDAEAAKTLCKNLLIKGQSCTATTYPPP